MSECEQKKLSWVIPFGGNGFITSNEDPATESKIAPCGVANWVSSSSKIALYFHSEQPGQALVALRLSVPLGVSRISVTISYYDQITKKFRVCNDIREIEIEGEEYYLANCGIVDLPVAGYFKLEICGITKTGSYFAKLTDALLLSEPSSSEDIMRIRFVDDPADFYFGRRGPSVHLGFPIENSRNIEYFYNEIHVPLNQDVMGAYFCAIGFTGGYFGIQVNSEEERRILFSVWSEYNSDDPGEIPEDYKVKLLRRGEDVYVGEFGNEGAGAQSYLRYMWQAEKIYKFIIQGKPIDDERTMFTAWFHNGSDWNLIASFEKPKVSTYVKGPYSFSENFIPEMGHIPRFCEYSNQWARDVNGQWLEITNANFTADDASNREIRMDVAGGVGIQGDKQRFFLRNCGFFSDRVNPGTPFTRESSGTQPPVDVSLLP